MFLLHHSGHMQRIWLRVSMKSILIQYGILYFGASSWCITRNLHIVHVYAHKFMHYLLKLIAVIKFRITFTSN